MIECFYNQSLGRAAAFKCNKNMSKDIFFTKSITLNSLSQKTKYQSINSRHRISYIKYTSVSQEV